MQGLTFEYPVWFLLFCGLAGLAVALLLYYKDTTFREKGGWLNVLLGVLRWLVFSTIAALLLSPLLKYLEKDIQAPVVVVAQDVSESIALGTADTAAYKAKWKQLLGALRGDYELVVYQFGDAVREGETLQFEDKRSNLQDALAHISDLYTNQNLGAVILASDGIYNEGANPAYGNFQLQAPVYTIGLGDTTRRRDLLLRRVFHNKIAYLNDRFSIQIDISAQNAKGSRSRLSVARVVGSGSQALHSEEISIDSDDFFQTKEVILDATAAGVQRYRISLSGIGDEVSTANNSRDIFVDVLDARQKILLLAASPHPDITAIKQALVKGKNNEVAVAYARSFSGDIRDFDLLVLHQLPGKKAGIEPVLASAAQLKKPIWYIVGEETNLNQFNANQALLSIRPKNAAANEVGAKLAGNFSLFTVGEELRQAIPSYPPLQAAFGDFTAGPNTNTMLLQRIGRVDTNYPLLLLGEAKGARQAVLAGTGLWQWRLFDFLDRQNHERFDELVSQISQYLSVQEDKRRFRVTSAKRLFDENEPVLLDAELYNSNYELINEPDATLLITDEAGQEYSYSFSRRTNTYTLDAGILPVGNYRYQAKANAGGEALTYDGQFSVQSVDVERFVLEADHSTLRLLSERFGGQFLLPQDMQQLPELLAASGTVKPILYSSTNTRSILNWKWLFFGLLGFLTLEWFLRRYFGGY